MSTRSDQAPVSGAAHPFPARDDDIGSTTGATARGSDASNLTESQTGMWARSVAMALLVATVTYVATVHLGFNLWDEGFLWDGVTKTSRGLVPIRDFYSYDPGRYYWCAAFVRLLGDSLPVLRFACMLYGAIGLTLAAYMLQAVTRDWRVAFLCLAAMSFWIAWVFRTFEHTNAILAVFAGHLLVRRPSSVRFFVLGAVSGVVAVFGRNYGLYAVVANLLLFVYVRMRGTFAVRLRDVGTWSVGVVVGYLPMIVMLAFVPGFAAANVEWTERFIAAGQTNLQLPYPWPWRVARLGSHLMWDSVAFSVLLLVLVAGCLWLAARRPSKSPAAALLLAALPVALTTYHHALSRSDIVHLSEASQPLLLVGFALAAAARPSRRRAAMLVTSVAFALLAMLGLQREHPFFAMWRDSFQQVPWQEADVAGSRVRLRPSTFEAVERFQAFAAEHLKDDAFAVLPVEAGLYRLVGRVSPLYDTFSLLPASAATQERMIRELAAARLRWVLVWRYGADGRSELTFPKTHPEVWQYLRANFTTDVAESRRLDHYVFRAEGGDRPR